MAVPLDQVIGQSSSLGRTHLSLRKGNANDAEENRHYNKKRGIYVLLYRGSPYHVPKFLNLEYECEVHTNFGCFSFSNKTFNDGK